jgi:hypothetical protein
MLVGSYTCAQRDGTTITVGLSWKVCTSGDSNQIHIWLSLLVVVAPLPDYMEALWLSALSFL